MSSPLPGWLSPLVAAARDVRAEQLSRFLPPATGGRAASVLILLADGAHGPDVLLIERALEMRSHPGQPAFPGGAADPGDTSAEHTALREAQEETGLDVAGVSVVATLPALWLPPSGFVVTPVLGWWHTPSPVHAADPVEVSAVHRVPLSVLADPERRVRVTHPAGFVGPGFEVPPMLVWGFTAGLLDKVLAMGGWEQPWDPSRLRELPAADVALAARTAARSAPVPPP